MHTRLVALDGGSDIELDRAMMVVGRHPLCDIRLDSLRISRHHCCMTPEESEVVVRDLGSMNGIRINGERVERGRLRPGDELSIAHIRYRLESGFVQELTIAGPPTILPRKTPMPSAAQPSGREAAEQQLLDRPLADVVRDALGSVPEKCRIQVIVRMDNDLDESTGTPDQP